MAWVYNKVTTKAASQTGKREANGENGQFSRRKIFRRQARRDRKKNGTSTSTTGVHRISRGSYMVNVEKIGLPTFFGFLFHTVRQRPRDYFHLFRSRRTCCGRDT